MPTTPPGAGAATSAPPAVPARSPHPRAGRQAGRQEGRIRRAEGTSSRECRHPVSGATGDADQNRLPGGSRGEGLAHLYRRRRGLAADGRNHVPGFETRPVRDRTGVDVEHRAAGARHALQVAARASCCSVGDERPRAPAPVCLAAVPPPRTPSDNVSPAPRRASLTRQCSSVGTGCPPAVSMTSPTVTSPAAGPAGSTHVTTTPAPAPEAAATSGVSACTWMPTSPAGLVTRPIEPFRRGEYDCCRHDRPPAAVLDDHARELTSGREHERARLERARPGDHPDEVGPHDTVDWLEGGDKDRPQRESFGRRLGHHQESRPLGPPWRPGDGRGRGRSCRDVDHGQPRGSIEAQHAIGRRRCTGQDGRQQRNRQVVAHAKRQQPRRRIASPPRARSRRARRATARCAPAVAPLRTPGHRMLG